MRGIERVVAAILLAGAVVGAAAFAHMLGRNPDLGSQLGLPRPGGPRIVQAAPLPVGPLVLSPVQTETLPRSAAPGEALSSLRPAKLVRLAPTLPSTHRAVSPAPARPTRPTPAPAPSTPAPAAPAPAAPAPAAPAPVSPAPAPAPSVPATPVATPPVAVPVPPKPVTTPTPTPTPVTAPPVVHPTVPDPPVAAPPAVVTSPPLSTSGPVLPAPGPALPVDGSPDTSTATQTDGGNS